MKVLKFFVLFVFATAMISCSSDDNDTPTYEFNQENLTGTYDNMKNYQSVYKKTVNLGNGISTSVTVILSFDYAQNIVYNFAPDNTLTRTGVIAAIKTVKKDDEVINTKDTIINLDLLDDVSYTVNEGNKTITINNDTYNVTDFSSSELVIKIPETTSTDNENNTIKYSKEIHLSR